MHKIKINKAKLEFSKDKSHKDGHRTQCKSCCVEYWHKFRQENYHQIQEKDIKYRKNHRKNYPWLKHYHDAKQRCTNPNNDSYKYYGVKGIKMLMIANDFKKLWFRDKAYLLKKPSIDRIDDNGHYKFSNCRFIELVENIKRIKK